MEGFQVLFALVVLVFGVWLLIKQVNMYSDITDLRDTLREIRDKINEIDNR
jgi:hypothetical protein